MTSVSRRVDHTWFKGPAKGSGRGAAFPAVFFDLPDPAWAGLPRWFAEILRQIKHVSAKNLAMVPNAPERSSQKPLESLRGGHF